MPAIHNQSASREHPSPFHTSTGTKNWKSHSYGSSNVSPTTREGFCIFTGGIGGHVEGGKPRRKGGVASRGVCYWSNPQKGISENTQKWLSCSCPKIFFYVVQGSLIFILKKTGSEMRSTGIQIPVPSVSNYVSLAMLTYALWTSVFPNSKILLLNSNSNSLILKWK